MERRIALERMGILFGLAEEEAVQGHVPRAWRYGGLAARLGGGYNRRRWL